MTADDHPDSRWVTLAEAATILNRAPRTLRRWAGRGMYTELRLSVRGKPVQYTRVRHAKLWAFHETHRDHDDDDDDGD